jgi:RNA polymerase sigma-70 factor (ECF subfamily)
MPPTPVATPTDPDWVRSVVARYERQLTAYACHVMHSVDGARDVVQETFVRLCGADRKTVEPRLAQWLFTVCRNLAIDVMRKERRMSMLSDAQASGYESNEPGPSDAAERDDSVSSILQSMAELPEVQQEVIRLKFQHGLSSRQIGEIMNLTVTNVGFLIHTGLKTLRQRLTGDTVSSNR